MDIHDPRHRFMRMVVRVKSRFQRGESWFGFVSSLTSGATFLKVFGFPNELIFVLGGFLFVGFYVVGWLDQTRFFSQQYENFYNTLTLNPEFDKMLRRSRE